MSTAAPSAGSVAPAAPAATPAGTPAAPTPEAQPVAKPIKPIPPRPKLPGVMEDGPEDATTRPRENRDPATGRFVSGGKAPIDAAPPVSEVALPGQRPDAPDPEAVPDLPESKPKFKFAGHEFDTAEAAEQFYRSMEGRHKPIQQKATEYEGKLVKAAESARGWHGEAQRLAAENEQLKAQLSGNRPADPAAAAPESKGIDWDLYADITRVATEAGEPWKAQQWLVEQIEAQRKADFAAYQQQLEAPIREREAAEAEQAEMARTADAIVASMAAHKNPDGTPAFPEYADGATAHAVGQLWASLGLDPRIALSPGGAVAAVALYRLARAMDGAVAPAPAPAPEPPAPPPDPAALAAAGLEGGRPLLPAAGSRRELDPGVARIVAGLKNTQLLRPGLGFEA